MKKYKVNVNGTVYEITLEVMDGAPAAPVAAPAAPAAPAAAAALPQTGTTSWMAGVLASLGSLLLACGWFFTRKQYSPKH